MYQYKPIYTIDFSQVKYYLEMHKVLQSTLDLPDYYGCNWDAFWDCLTDMIGRKTHIRILGIENIERLFGDEADILLDILKDFKHYDNGRYSDDIRIEVVKGNATVTLN